LAVLRRHGTVPRAAAVAENCGAQYDEDHRHWFEERPTDHYGRRVVLESAAAMATRSLGGVGDDAQPALATSSELSSVTLTVWLAASLVEGPGTA